MIIVIPYSIIKSVYKELGYEKESDFRAEYDIKYISKRYYMQDHVYHRLCRKLYELKRGKEDENKIQDKT